LLIPIEVDQEMEELVDDEGTTPGIEAKSFV
jgi:hypothetical protein